MGIALDVYCKPSLRFPRCKLFCYNTPYNLQIYRRNLLRLVALRLRETHTLTRLNGVVNQRTAIQIITSVKPSNQCVFYIYIVGVLYVCYWQYTCGQADVIDGCL